MPALVAGIHVLKVQVTSKTWMAGTSPAMTWKVRRSLQEQVSAESMGFADAHPIYALLRRHDMSWSLGIVRTMIRCSELGLEDAMQFWVIGGEFTSLNFHSFNPGTAVVEGPFPTRAEAEVMWKSLSENTKYKANYRFVITVEPDAKE